MGVAGRQPVTCRPPCEGRRIVSRVAARWNERLEWRPEPALPLAAGGADEAGSRPGRVLGRDAVLHGANRTRSGDLCKRGPDTLQLLR